MNGKGSKPRNCLSKRFKTNFDLIDWSKKKNKPKPKKKVAIVSI